MNETEKWWAEYIDSLPPGYGQFIALEDEAESIFTFDPLFVPGLFQTEAYARKIVARHHPLMPARVMPARVKVRMARQWHVLEKPNPPEIHALIEEPALRRLIGGAQVQYSQLLHVARLARLPNITIQILPLAEGAIWPESYFQFTILSCKKQELLSVEQSFVDHLNTDDSLKIAHYRTEFMNLCDAALSPEESTGFILRVAEQIRSAE